jgi:sulfite reductase alpha subunit-like flavoprotein
MAPQVRAALLTIAQTHGDLSLEEAQAFLAEMESANRYCEDVY